MELTRARWYGRLFRCYRWLRLHLRDRWHLLPLKWLFAILHLRYWRSSVAIVHRLALAVGLLKMVVSCRHLTCVDLLLLLEHLLFIRHFLRLLCRCRQRWRLPSLILRNGLMRCLSLIRVSPITAKYLWRLGLDGSIIACILVVVEITRHNYRWCIRRV